jgi:hypothetical protein
MEAMTKKGATKAGFIGNRAVEDYHATHVEHLTATLPMRGVDGFFSCPACRTNPLTHARRSIVVEHMRTIAKQQQQK